MFLDLSLSFQSRTIEFQDNFPPCKYLIDENQFVTNAILNQRVDLNWQPQPNQNSVKLRLIVIRFRFGEKETPRPEWARAEL